MLRSARFGGLAVTLVVLVGCRVDPEPPPEEATLGTVTSRLDLDEAASYLRRPRVEIPTPELDVSGLHERWAEQGLTPEPCRWRAYQVGSPRDLGAATGLEIQRADSIAAALTSAQSDRTVCGPVLVVGPGRWASPTLAITKPTILVGGDDVVLSTTLASTAGQPLWIQDVVFDDAPFPGAMFVSHPSAESTVIRVRVQNTRGVGLIHNGGILTMFDSVMQGLGATTTIPDDPRVDRDALRTGFGQPGASAAVPRTAPRIDLMDPVLQVLRRDEGFDKWLEISESARDYSPYDLLTACNGVGTILHGALAYLASDTYALNDSAGLVIDDSLVEGMGQGALLNGLVPFDDKDWDTLSSGARCFGGIQLKRKSSIALEGGGAVGNTPVGIVGAKNTVVILGSFIGMSSQSTSGNWGAGITGGAGSFFSLTDVDLEADNLCGGLFISATANIYSGALRDNVCGIGNVQCSTVWVAPEVDFENNASNVVTDNACGFSVPDSPAPLPQ